jgi:hypothetical protein
MFECCDLMCDNFVWTLVRVICFLCMGWLCFSLGKDLGKFLVQVFEWVLDWVCPAGGCECFKTTVLLFWGWVLVGGFFLIRAIRLLYC